MLGCDFSSSPSKRKPVVVALGQATQGVLSLRQLKRFDTLDGLEGFLQTLPYWIGGFDMPFGLPRELVQTLGWPQDWLGCVQHFTRLSRAQVRTEFKAYCDARPAGQKMAHRATDRPAGSSPSMKWVNPPVAYMMHAGVPLLLRLQAVLPGVHRGTCGSRIALEAYPGLLMRELIGRQSYKSDERSRQTPERQLARQQAVQAMLQGSSRLQLALHAGAEQRDVLVQDASGDSLDAVACLMQAAWGARQAALGDKRFGLPAAMDPLEGWILSA